jgi:7-cyano-7-deazaguanine synthase
LTPKTQLHEGATLAVDYGQRHIRELEAASGIAAHYGIPHHALDLSSWGALLKGSALTDTSRAVPDGHYADPAMAATVVPNRNATLLMAAAGVAESLGASKVLIGVHAGDHTVYPDCRPEFIAAAVHAAHLGTGGKVTIDAPFLHHTKARIAALGASLGAPMHLSWSCYRGGARHCGSCGTCVERIEAFRDSGVTDPTTYLIGSAA